MAWRKLPLCVSHNKHGVDCVGLLCRVWRRHFACYLQRCSANISPTNKLAPLKKLRAQSQPQRRPPGFLPIATAFVKCNKFARDNPRTKVICDFIIEMMTLDDQPFTIPSLKIRACCWLVCTSQLCTFIFRRCVCQQNSLRSPHSCIHRLMEIRKEISFTTDLWTCDVSHTLYLFRIQSTFSVCSTS